VRRTYSLLALLAAVLCLGFVVTACGGDDEESSSSSSSSGSSGGEAPGKEIQKVSGAESKPTITVGSKNFTEQFVLGEIYSQALEAAGFKVKKQLNLGSELIAYKALQAGKVDAYPEYTGTALTSFFGVKTADVPKDANQAYEDAKAGFAKKDITALAPTPFENTYRLGMTKEGAAKIGDPKTISDLKGKEGDLSITGFPECKQRQDCLLGVEDTYGLKFGKFVSSEQKYQVLDSGDADVAFIFTTDGDLAGGKYAILDDDKKFFPPYNVTFNVRNDALKNLGPEGQKVIEAVQEPLTEKVMQELNARVDIDKQKPEEAAASYLKQAGFVK
jgi:glycine betaine/choline ABC-type transport system substrate-binding protein